MRSNSNDRNGEMQQRNIESRGFFSNYQNGDALRGAF
jgi:hypothetical protein